MSISAHKVAACGDDRARLPKGSRLPRLAALKSNRKSFRHWFLIQLVGQGCQDCQQRILRCPLFRLQGPVVVTCEEWLLNCQQCCWLMRPGHTCESGRRVVGARVPNGGRRGHPRGSDAGRALSATVDLVFPVGGERVTRRVVEHSTPTFSALRASCGEPTGSFGVGRSSPCQPGSASGAVVLARDHWGHPRACRVHQGEFGRGLDWDVKD
jgi:hypothetical protein